MAHGQDKVYCRGGQGVVPRWRNVVKSARVQQAQQPTPGLAALQCISLLNHSLPRCTRCPSSNKVSFQWVCIRGLPPLSAH
jgi:hypothetical protein